jgi:glycosyltransferase involved in cell wall biosynthesis
MRIVIAVVSSTVHLSGVTRHAANMARCLLLRPDVSSVHLVVAPWQYESFHGAMPQDDPKLQIHQVSIGESTLSRNLWYYNDLPPLAAQLGADIVHLAYPAPVKRSAFQCPVVATLHDLYPYDIPTNFGFPKVFFNRAILQQCLRSVDAIACVSDQTSQRLGAFTSRTVQKKAVTIYNCVEPGPPMAAKGPLPELDSTPFLLCVAQHRRNKNIVFAMRIFQRLLLDGHISPSARFVVVGIEGPETERIHHFIRESGLGDQISLLRGIDDAELQWCYGHCELLLAPSVIEGFGLPIVEAMYHGCRVVCSDIPVFQEVGGSYCHYASLQPPAEKTFVDAASRALQGSPPPPGGTDRFSGKQVAESYLQLYTRLRTLHLTNTGSLHHPAMPANGEIAN